MFKRTQETKDGPAARPAMALVALFALLAICLAPSPAQAAITLKGQFKTEDAYNPKPDGGDLSLPMPCDLAMVFRVVSIPVTGKNRDFETFLGNDTVTNNAFLENRQQSQLGSDLSLANLPKPMADIASKVLSNASTDQLYLIGKYEVTKGQWDSIMGDGGCAMDAKSAKPVSEISYFQALDFIDRYNKWLIGNHRQSLPSYEGKADSVGLVRLPTEEEWEYAARGGHEVSTDKIATQDFFDIPPGTKRREYGLFAEAGYNIETEPGNVGRWKPNPLGLFDTAGNVAEMVGAPFKMIKHKRPHGSAGGFVSKGGSYDQEFEYVLPGRRVERPYYFSNGPTLSKDLGLRLVVVAPEAVTSTERQDAFRKSFKVQPPADREKRKDRPKGVDETIFQGIESKTTIEKVEALIESAIDDDQREAFESLRADIQDFKYNTENATEKAIRTNCRNLLFTVYSIHNTDKRRRDALADAQLGMDQLAQLRGLSAEDQQQYRKQIQALTAATQKNYEMAIKQAEGFALALTKQFKYYVELLAKHDTFDRFEVNNVMIMIQQDIKGDDIYAKAMRNAHQQVNYDLGNWRLNKKEDILLDSILQNGI